MQVKLLRYYACLTTLIHFNELALQSSSTLGSIRTIPVVVLDIKILAYYTAFFIFLIPDSDLAPRTRNKTEGGRKYVEKSTSEWSNKHKNHIPHTNRCAHKNDTGSGIIRVTGPPSNRTPHRFSGRYHDNQSAAYSRQRTRTSPFQAATNADISLSESFKESCSIWDKGVTYNGGFRNDCETARQSGENYSDYEDWDSDNSSDLIQRCFELSQSPPDPERPDIHSVLQSLMHENSDDTYEQFKQDLYGSRAQSYYYYSGASAGPKTFREHFDEEGMKCFRGLVFFADDSSDDTESNNGIPANDLRHRIGRLAHGLCLNTLLNTISSLK